MISFNTSLLRERFVIQDKSVKKSNVTALSNRLVVGLKRSEQYVVRGHTMHCVLRMGAQILRALEDGGSIKSRGATFNWQGMWGSVLNDFEYAYNSARWVTVYRDGLMVFSRGSYHSFFDMIERCDQHNELDYDFAVPLAEQAFKAEGQDFKIRHESNVALSAHFDDQGAGRVGVILRGPKQTTTFSFSTNVRVDGVGNTWGEGGVADIAQSLNGAAAFLEGIQLAYVVGVATRKLRTGSIAHGSGDEAHLKDGKQRLVALAAEITQMEHALGVKYRPEKPIFQALVAEAEALG